MMVLGGGALVLGRRLRWSWLRFISERRGRIVEVDCDGLRPRPRRSASSPKALWAAATACCFFWLGSSISDFVGAEEGMLFSRRGRRMDFLQVREA